MNNVTLGEITPKASSPAIERLNACVTRLDLAWGIVACTAIPLSLFWDFSWESSIGVDRFWSPPHLATHIGVWLGGLLALWLILRFTIARGSGRQVGVCVGHFCGPSGAWVLLWSALLFEATIPLDVWWQRAYGLGAGLWPPPQILKTVAFFGLLFGGMLLSLARQNAATRRDDLQGLTFVERKTGESRWRSQLFSCTRSLPVTWFGGLVLALCFLIMVMTNFPNRQHTAFFDLISCGVYPGLLLFTLGAARCSFGTTMTALAYLIATGAMVWLLPLFPAHPLTPPVHNPITHMVPPPFPLLLFAPAVGIDLLRYAGSRMRSQPQQLAASLVAGVAFVAIFSVVQWSFAGFLLSPLSDNWFFAGGGRHWPYFLKIDQARMLFWNGPADGASIETFVLAAALASASAWLGITIGAWLQRVRR